VALWHFDRLDESDTARGWINITSSLNTDSNIVCGITDDLSPFAVGLAIDPMDVGEEISGALPLSFGLRQNYPNPFNPQTSVEYSVPKRSHVLIEIYNITGQRVRTLVDGTVPPGTYRIVWDGKNAAGQSVASGVYLYRFQAGDHVDTKKMVLLK
jgi:hypothetical protein